VWGWVVGVFRRSVLGLGSLGYHPPPCGGYRWTVVVVGIAAEEWLWDAAVDCGRRVSEDHVETGAGQPILPALAVWMVRWWSTIEVEGRRVGG